MKSQITKTESRIKQYQSRRRTTITEDQIGGALSFIEPIVRILSSQDHRHRNPNSEKSQSDHRPEEIEEKRPRSWGAGTGFLWGSDEAEIAVHSKMDGQDQLSTWQYQGISTNKALKPVMGPAHYRKVLGN